MIDTPDSPSFDDIHDALFELRHAGFKWSRSMKSFRPVEDYRRALVDVPKLGLEIAVKRLVAGEIGDQSGFIPIPQRLAELAIQQAREAMK